MKTSLKLFAILTGFLTFVILLQSCGSSFNSTIGNKTSNEPYWRSWNKASNISGPALSLKKYVSERLRESARNKGDQDFYLDAAGKTIGFISEGIQFRIKEGTATGTIQIREHGQMVERVQSFNILHISFSPSPGCAYPESGDIIIEFASDYCYDCITVYYTPSNVNSLQKIQFADASIRTFWEKVFGALQQFDTPDFHDSAILGYAGVSQP